jgi:hypothetical protein
MARRASSSSPNLKVIGGVVLVLATLIGAYAFFGQTQDAYRTTSVFPVKEYLENANSLRGNTYRLEAVIDKTLEVAPDSGRLISVEAAGDMLPLFVPNKLNGLNIERSQKFLFKVQVDSKGLIIASDIRKS